MQPTSCKSLREELDLYAEGELRDRDARRRIQRHLDECWACVERLRLHDALTRDFLAAGAHEVCLPVDGGRVDRIMEQVRAAPVPVRMASGALLDRAGAASPGRRAGGGRAISRWLRRAAAALLLGLLLHSLYLFLPPGDGAQEGLLSRRGDRGPPPGAGANIVLAAQAGGDDEVEPVHAGDWSWVLDAERHELGDVWPSGLEFRLYGFRRQGGSPERPEAALAASERGRWVVEAVSGARRSSQLGPAAEKFFLVPEAWSTRAAAGFHPRFWREADGAVEIHPVSLHRVSGAVPVLPASPARLPRRGVEGQGGILLYKLYMVNSAPSLQGSLPPLKVEAGVLDFSAIGSRTWGHRFWAVDFSSAGRGAR